MGNIFCEVLSNAGTHQSLEEDAQIQQDLAKWRMKLSKVGHSLEKLTESLDYNIPMQPMSIRCEGDGLKGVTRLVKGEQADVGPARSATRYSIYSVSTTSQSQSA